jgi:transcription termination/antitermination protein NusA
MKTDKAHTEILQVADTVAREKGIDREEVIIAMEMAVQKAGKAKYGLERDIRASISRENGAISLDLYIEVVEEVENDQAQITLDDAKIKKEDAAVGDFIIERLPPIEFGRIAAQTAKQVIIQKVREAERERQYEEYKDRVGEVINCLVKRIDFGNLIVDLGKTEAIIRKDELIPRESYRPGDRVRAYIMEVSNDPRGHQVKLSRTAPEFMAKLFAQEVPEIYDGAIEVKSVARDPGSRAKIAVYSADSGVDPVGACVGMRGSRVQAVVAELQGEKVDIVQWSPDPATYIINALAPSEPIKVVVDEDENRIEVVVPDDQLSLAIGRRGQNVRLASILSGWSIDIQTESEESTKRTEDFTTRSELFMEGLDVDDVISHLLVVEGFTSIDEVAFVELSELESIEGFDADIAEELQNRAKVFAKERDDKIRAELAEDGVEQYLLELEGLPFSHLQILVKKGIKTRDDLADLATDELIELIPAKELTIENAEKLIMKAREHWFTGDEQQA